MARYDRQYDFGLRGYRQTTRPMMDQRYRAGAGFYDAGYRGRYDERAFGRERLPNRVTARYNLDYVVGHQRDPYDREYNMYTGDHPERIGDDHYMRRPYMTRGGTRTFRGSSVPIGYDFPNYGPDYGGRYPDEL